MEEDTSSASSATPIADQPATGNTSGSATPPKSPLTLEEVQRENDELKRSQMNAREELERHRKKLTAYEKAEQEREAAKKAQEEAQLSEIERIKKQFAEIEAKAKHYQQQFVTAQVKLAAQGKGIIDPDLAALALAGTLEYDEDGMPTNLDKALDALIKNKPYLVQQKAAEPPTPAPAETVQQTPRAPSVPAMNPGRTQITQPGAQQQTAKPVRLSDLNWKR